MTDTNNEFIYKIINVDGIFMGLNQRAVDYLLKNGDWYTLDDVDNYGYDGNTGMLFVCSDNTNGSALVEHGESDSGYITGELMACLYGNQALPTLVYDWLPANSDNNTNPEIKFIPLYKYKLNNSENEWAYEDLDVLKSDLYEKMKLIKLKDAEGEDLFSWTQNELEQSEMILEYNMGI